LTFTVLKPLKRGEITEFKIKTVDFNFIAPPKNIRRRRRDCGEEFA
jgi:hypothetical protein